jgi:hypothetical protein
VVRCGYLLHLHTDVLLSLLRYFDFRFSILENGPCKACYRDGIKIFIRGGVLFYEEEREGRGGFLWYSVGI